MADVASTAVASRGTVLKLKKDSVFVRLGDMTDVEIPGFDTEIIDATHQESPQNTREKLGGLIDPGEITATLRFTPGSDELDAIYENAGKICDWRIDFPADLPSCTFQGILKGWKPAAAGISGLLEGSLSIAVSGPLVWADEES